MLWKDNDMGRIMTNKNEGKKYGLTFTILSDDNIKWGRTWGRTFCNRNLCQMKLKAYIILVIFAPQTRMFTYFLLHTQGVNRDKTDIASKRR